MNSVASLEKLNGENYAAWSIQIKSLLITLDLWDVIRSTCPVEDNKQAAWSVMDQKALAMINLSVKPGELIHIKDCTTAKGAWDSLSGLYKANTACRKVNLFKKLVRFRISSGEKISTQIGEFRGIIDDLKTIGIVLNQDFVAVLLLCALPEEMENFVVAVESRDDLPNMEQLVSKILEEERRQREKGNLDNDKVFSVNEMQKHKGVNKGNNRFNRKNTRIEGDNKRSNIRCYKCGQKGHIRSHCKSDVGESVASALCRVNKRVEFNKVWILDSGASSHMCNSGNLFSCLQKEKQKIVLASGETVFAEGKGTVEIKSKYMRIKLINVLYVPSLHSNFLSVSKFIEAGHTISFARNSANITSKENNKMMYAVKENGIFVAKVENVVSAEYVYGATTENEFIKWHSRFGHLNSKDLKILCSKNMVRGLNLKVPDNYQCVTCAVGKITARPFNTYSQINTKAVLELVHTDLCGPFRIKSQGGALYMMTFTDDFSRYVFAYFLKQKSDAFDVFLQFVTMAEKQSGCKLLKIRSDNGKEYINFKFKDYFQKNGIMHQTTISHTPQQNGIAERINRTLVEMARCMLYESGLPQNLWAEAVSTSVYIRNRSPTKVLGEVTPYEKWHNRKPSVTHLRRFGCDAVVLQKNSKCGKLMPKGVKMKLVGYECMTKGYRLYNSAKREIVKARDVIFFENSFEKLQNEGYSCEEFCVNIFHSIREDDNIVNTDEPLSLDESFETASEDEVQNENVEEEEANEEFKFEEKIKRGRGRPKLIFTGQPGRPRKQYASATEMLNSIVENPANISEALNSDEASEWKSAMEREYNSLIKNKTWVLVDRPKSKNIIGSKWVFAIKRKPDGSIEKYKARLVAQGNCQKFNVDYHETFAPVVRHSTIRILLALAVQYKLLLRHVDVVSAYLNANLEDEVFMEQPPMFKNSVYPDKVCKLIKALYGLRQAGREWNRKVSLILLEMRFQRCQTDNCIYFRRNGDRIIIIALYVDDMMIVTSTEADMNQIIIQLNKYIEAEDRGPISFYLGLEIEREGDRGPVQIHQRKYTLELLKTWKMMNSKPASTPWPCGTVLKKCEKNMCKLDPREYQSLIGGLMYLAVISRPDIAHVVSKLSQFNTHPHEEHMQAAKHLLRYLVKEPDKKISFTGDSPALICYTDADWGCDTCDRKSYSGFVMLMAGGTVAWESKKQTVVALSSMEAEYVALCQGGKEVVFARSLIGEIGFEEFIKQPTVIFSDNQGANFMVKNPAIHKRSKHIDIRFHYIRERYNDGSLNVVYVPSEDNAADIFTKVLSKQKHARACELLRM